MAEIAVDSLVKLGTSMIGLNATICGRLNLDACAPLLWDEWGENFDMFINKLTGY